MSPDDRRILPLTLTIAADLLNRQITLIGPDAASSAEYGRDRPGPPIELIPLAVGGGFSSYLLAEPPAPSINPALAHDRDAEVSAALVGVPSLAAEFEDLPGDAVAAGSVGGTGSGFRVVGLPAGGGGVDLGPVRELLRNERVFALVEAFLGLEPGTLIGAVIGVRRPVRIVVAAMPAGVAGDAVIRRLWDEFGGLGRVGFAPAPGHRVVVAGDGELAVVTERGQAGWWVQVGSGLPGRYLGQDLMNPDVDVTEGELILWMVRDSAVPASLDPEPGESQRSFGLEIEFVFEDGLRAADRAERIRRIIDDLRRFGLTEQAEIAEAHSTRAAGYTSRRPGWRVEEDATVHGEVVSPILPYRDGTAAQRVWHDIALVLGVIRRHGGGNDRRAGGHVHLGVGDYQRDAETLLRLIGLFRAHQDSVYRLATTPGEIFTRLVHARPLPEPERGENGQWKWADFGYRDWSALNLFPLRRDYHAGRPAESDHIEARIFDGFLARQLGLGGVRARVEVIRALADAALIPSGTAGDLPSELGDSFLSHDPDVVVGAAALDAATGPVPGQRGPGAGAGEAAVGTHPLAAC